MEMLIKLPDRDSSFNGGWLFDYETDEDFKDDFVVSNGWRFYSAYKIDEQISSEEKRRGIKLKLMGEGVFES